MKPHRVLFKFLLAALVAGGLLGQAVAAQDQGADAKLLVGSWNGVLKPAPELELRIVVKVKADDDGKLSAVMISPDQSPAEIPVDNLKLDGKKVSFNVNRIGVKYQGTLDADKKEVVGQWTQGPASLALNLTPGEGGATEAPEAPAELLGLWEGSLDVGVAKLRLVLRVEKVDGKPVAFLDSPDQSVKGIPVTAIALEGQKLTFECKGISGLFSGMLDEPKQAIDGTWTQVGRSYPLKLEKTDKVSEVKRPQNPIEPLPYVAEKVEYSGKEAGITLAGTLTLPPGEGPFPAVVLITGSGPQDRDEALMGHRPFYVLSDHLTRRGIAVLRSDDRGFGESKGRGVMQSTSEDLAGDALAGVEFLKQDSRIASDKIGLAGHSEGGLIAPIAAVRDPSIAFIVLLAGTGVTGEEIVLTQTALIARAGGSSEEDITKQTDALGKLIEIIKSESDPEKAGPLMMALIEEENRKEAEQKKAEAGSEDKGDDDKKADESEASGKAAATAAVSQLNNPWFRYFLTYDPRTNLERVKCPVLAINGEKDLQVPPGQNLPEIEKALLRGGNTAFLVQEFPGLNHLFQTSESGSPKEYATIEETMSPVVLDRVAGWILERTQATDAAK